MHEHLIAPPSSRGRGRRSRSARALAAVARALAIVLFMLSSPGVCDTVRDLVAATSGVACPEGDDCERGDGSCLRTCGHCGCCGHTSPAPVPSELSLVPPALAASAAPWPLERGLGSGYRAPPFRPPASHARA